MAKKKKSYWTRLLKICRQEWARNNPIRKECFNNARSSDNTKLDKWICACCKSWFALSEVSCDHKTPIQNTIPQNKKEFLISFERVEVDLYGLQILCHKCHKEKTKNEIRARKDELLIKLVEAQMINNGWNITQYSICDLDKIRLRKVTNLFSKNEKISNGKIISRNNLKIHELLKPCFIEIHKYG